MQEKHARFKAQNTLKMGGKTAETNENKTAYIDVEHVAKHAVWLKKSEAEEEFATMFPVGEGVFCIWTRRNIFNFICISGTIKCFWKFLFTTLMGNVVDRNLTLGIPIFGFCFKTRWFGNTVHFPLDTHNSHPIAHPRMREAWRLYEFIAW